MAKNVLFISPYPYDTAPSQRFRFEQYLGFLKEQNISYKQASFLNQSTWKILYKPGHYLQKITGILGGFIRRNILLFTLGKYDFIFIHREAAPIGPPIFEWIITKLLGKKVIYDFDDAIWLPNTSENNKIAAGIKWHSKVKSICKWADKVTCGNDFLADFARKAGGKEVIVLPTTIDMVNVHNRTKQYSDSRDKKIILGWTGTHSTMHYLERLIPILKSLEDQFPDSFELRIISNKKPDYPLNNITYIAWNKDQEIDDLLTFDIGLMPLTDDLWAKGKCGFKALQYMSLGIPAIVSPVGANTQIVSHGKNGFISNSEEDWKNQLENLILGKHNLPGIGSEAREFIKKNYSVESQKKKFISLFTQETG